MQLAVRCLVDPHRHGSRPHWTFDVVVLDDIGAGPFQPAMACPQRRAFDRQFKRVAANEEPVEDRRCGTAAVVFSAVVPSASAMMSQPELGGLELQQRQTPSTPHQSER
jgi:hypothetical protein